MKFEKKKLLEKALVVICIMIILFNFIIPIKSKADDAMEKAGGVLFEPIKDLLISVSDSLFWIMQYAFYGNTDSVYQYVSNDLDDYRTIKVPSWVKGTDQKNIEVPEEAFEGGYFHGYGIEIPQIRVSPEAIFSNKVPAFDINFFNPMDKEVEEEKEEEITVEMPYISFVNNLRDIKDNKELEEKYSKYEKFLKEVCYIRVIYGIKIDSDGNCSLWENYSGKYTEYYTRWQSYSQEELKKIADDYLKVYQSSYENQERINPYPIRGILEWLEGEMRASAKENAITSGPYANIEDEEILRDLAASGVGKVTTIERESSAKILQPIVSFWYNLLRNISVIGLLSVLLYIGIKIVTSSIASEKSKYKEMLKDWLIALLLLFFMHYFMSLIITITTSVSSALVGGNNNDVYQTTVNNSPQITYFGDKLMGDVRLQLQVKDNFAQMLSYTIIYLVLVIYSIIFSVIYLKRVIYMAFFTMIAPLVALTYPLDKIRDGKAQAFEYWMKEYIFNALIQPVHLVLYYVLVGSSLELAKENPIYALVAIGFIMPADKLIRKFFGFDKATTAGALGGAFSGALAVQGFNAIKKRLSGGSNGKGKDENDKKDKPVRTADSGNNTGKLMSDIAGGNGDNARENNQEEAEARNIRQQRENAFREEQNSENIRQNEQEQESERIRQSEQNEQEGNEEQNVRQNQNNANNEESGNGKAIKAKALTVAKIAGKGLKFAGKTALRAYGAATLGTLGVAAGLASEKYSNAFTYGLGGAVAGKMAADAGMKFAGKTLPSAAYRIKKGYEGIRDESEQQVYTKKERAKIANERADNAFRRDREAIKQYKYAFGKDNYEAAMEAAINYRRYGITDNDTIIKAMQMNSRGLGSLDDKKRILAAKLAPQVKNEKDIEQIEGRLRANGFTNEQIENMKDAIRKYNDMG